MVRVRAGHEGRSTGHRLGDSAGTRPFATSPKITCGQGGGTSEAAAGAASLQPSAQALSLPTASQNAMSPSAPLLCPCGPCCESPAEPAAAGANIPPRRPRAGACQPPTWLSRNQHRSDGQQISVLQQMPPAVSKNPYPHQGKITAGCFLLWCYLLCQPVTQHVPDNRARGSRDKLGMGEGAGCGGGTQLGRCQPWGCGGAGISPRLQCSV